MLIPLFSCESSRSWGIGEIPDLVPLAAWLARAGFDFVQILPINEMSAGQHSPYSAMSAMAIDPIYIALEDVADLAGAGGVQVLGPTGAADLAAARAAPGVEYDVVRRLKTVALRAAYEAFLQHEWRGGTERAEAFSSFAQREAWWLEPYARFRVLHADAGDRPWWEWPSPDAEPSEDEVRYRAYLQWLADAQWRDTRAAMGDVGVIGDLPFMVGRDSADVWSRQHLFLHDASVGVPPDAFSDTGQDWGIPPYRWDVMAAEDFDWLRQRARRSADLFAGYRVDHLVGFYRTYIRQDGVEERYFSPADEDQQLALGETIMAVFAEPGARIIAEDLGTVPDFVRASIARLGVPGYKVLRWERAWEELGQPFHEPSGYPAVSLATTGTHDTETQMEWWETADEDERRAVLALRSLRKLGGQAREATLSPALRDRMLEMLIASGSDFVSFPVQDLFGWRDRVNTPATVSESNWTWRLPWFVDRLDAEPLPAERVRTLRRWMERHDRRPARRRRPGRQVEARPAGSTGR